MYKRKKISNFLPCVLNKGVTFSGESTVTGSITHSGSMTHSWSITQSLSFYDSLRIYNECLTQGQNISKTDDYDHFNQTIMKQFAVFTHLSNFDFFYFENL